MEWYYAKDGQQNGPVSREQLAEIFSSGQISSGDLVWNDTMTDWVPIGTLSEFQSAGSPDPGEAQPAQEAPPAFETAAAAPVAAAANPTPSSEQVPTYLWQSIVCLVLCCLVGGIIALVYSTKVEPALQRGDVAAAREASKTAKMWCWISFGVGLVINIGFIALGAIGAMAEGLEGVNP
ncbi:MAG: CD225/dispanin family protein [Verrucomicrobiales bacterium]|nr:CD225/dispanin family protein [Verrucomicrobiales bacterium]